MAGSMRMVQVYRRSAMVGTWMQVSEGSTVWKRIARVDLSSNPSGPLLIFEDYTTRVLSTDGREGMNPEWFDALRPEG